MDADSNGIVTLEESRFALESLRGFSDGCKDYQVKENGKCVDKASKTCDIDCPTNKGTCMIETPPNQVRNQDFVDFNLIFG